MSILYLELLVFYHYGVKGFQVWLTVLLCLP